MVNKENKRSTFSSIISSKHFLDLWLEHCIVSSWHWCCLMKRACHKARCHGCGAGVCYNDLPLKVTDTGGDGLLTADTELSPRVEGLLIAILLQNNISKAGAPILPSPQFGKRIQRARKWVREEKRIWENTREDERGRLWVLGMKLYFSLFFIISFRYIIRYI